MQGLVFESQAAAPPSAPNRVDVACFVGFVDRRGGESPPPAPAPIHAWLDERGWLTPPYHRPSAARELLDVPVPIDSWETFHQLFDWESRQLDHAGRRGCTYLGAAVRSFFAQGGRRCYVVRVGGAWVPIGRQARRSERLAALLPGYPHRIMSSPVDPTTWHGVGHLLGLPDVSFLCLPDVPDIVGVDPPPPVPAVIPPPLEERFTECSAGEPVKGPDTLARLVHAPRCDDAAYEAWAGALEIVVTFLASRARDIQLVAAIPLPQPGSLAEARFSARIKGLIDRRVAGRLPLAWSPGELTRGLASSFIQLTYPWLRTTVSDSLPERLETPDGVLAGVLARNALTRGTFLSAAGSILGDVYDVYPLLRAEHLLARDESREDFIATAFDERVSILGRSPAGMRLLTDVTPSIDDSYRPANVHRLVSVIVRAARRIGETTTFDASGEAMWARVRKQLDSVLLTLLRAGALRGATPREAFRVRCDRTTMTQADLDAGRVIADVSFTAAAPIEQIRIVIALDDAGGFTAALADVGLEAA
jgi:uncharacterized protein